MLEMDWVPPLNNSLGAIHYYIAIFLKDPVKVQSNRLIVWKIVDTVDSYALIDLDLDGRRWPCSIDCNVVRDTVYLRDDFLGADKPCSIIAPSITRDVGAVPQLVGFTFWQVDSCNERKKKGKQCNEHTEQV